MKRVLTSITMFLLLGSLVAGLQLIDLAQGNFFPDPGPDLLRILIKSDGSVEPAMAPIERAGSFYRLTDDITMYTIEIQRDNLYFDGSGCLIQGNQSWMGSAPHHGDAGNNAIIITARNNITITNVKFEKCTTGVRIYNSTNIRITNNTFTKLTPGFGNALGVAVKNSSLVLVEDNYFGSFSGLAIACNGTNNILRGNTIAGSIDLEGSSNRVLDNIIKGMTPIIMNRANSNIIAKNNISGPAPNPYIVDQNRTGTEGIALFVSCSNNIIFENNITGFRGQAIRTVEPCSNNTIYGNYVANNGFAIVLQDGATDNTFYGNTFTADSCKIQIDDGVKGTRWDNGTIGNYWSDYNGTDANGDGIGDTPYIVNGHKWDLNVDGFLSYVSGQDNHPLMEPIDTSKIPLPKYAPHSPSISSSPSPTPEITSSPSQNPTSPTSSPTVTPSPSPAPSPTVPEFPIWILLVVLVATSLVFTFKWRINGK